MALILNDRVKETSTTTGLSDFALGGAATGFQSFSAGIGVNNTTYYAVYDATDWEVGLGTLSGDGLTLARTTIYKSSNANNKVNFGAGAKSVFVTYPADIASSALQPSDNVSSLTNDAGYIGSADIGVTVQPYDANALSSSDIGVTVQGYDATLLKSSDIGVSVQAFDATLLNDADIGVTVQGYDATILKSSDIGVSVQAYDATLLNDADIGVSVQAYDANITTATNTQTLTNKTVTGLKETKVAMGSDNIDLSTGNYFTKTIAGATTLTVSNTAASGSVSAFVLELTNGGSATVTFFSGVTWAAATAPTLTASGVDVLGFFTTDGGTTWRGFVLGLGMA